MRLNFFNIAKIPSDLKILTLKVHLRAAGLSAHPMRKNVLSREL